VILKRFLMAAIIIVVVLAVFWKDILATALMIYTKTSLPEDQLAVTVENYYPTATTSVIEHGNFNFGSLNFIIPFAVATSTESKLHYRAFKQDGTAFVVLDEIELKDTFMDNPEQSDEDKELLCQFLSSSYDEDVCDSNYSFFKAMTEANLVDVGLLSSRAEKLSQSILTTLRSTYMGTSAIETFKTDTVRGFIHSGADKTTIVTLFDDQDQQYTIISSMHPSHLSHVLATISPAE